MHAPGPMDLWDLWELVSERNRSAVKALRAHRELRC